MPRNIFKRSTTVRKLNGLAQKPPRGAVIKHLVAKGQQNAILNISTALRDQTGFIVLSLLV
jgi:hypothetical protein